MIKLEQRLKEARIERGLTLYQAAKATKIKPHFLEAIESGAYNELPSPAYARGFVRNYADFLGLPSAQVSALFKRDFDEKKSIQVLPDGLSTQREFPIRRINLRNVIISVLAVLLLSIFLLFQVRGILFPPSISLSSPIEGSEVSRDVRIVGKTDGTAVIAVNNEPVFVNTNGKFEKTIVLFPGKNVIIVKAKNRYGKESTLQREVTVK